MLDETTMPPADESPAVTEPVAPPPEAIEDATRDDVLALRNQRPREPFFLPTRQQRDGRPVWKRVWVYGLTQAEKKLWYESCARETGPHGETITDPFGDEKLMVRCVRDAAGTPLFTDHDLRFLIELPPLVRTPLVELCMKLCAMGGRADEEILKNFAALLAGVS